MEKKKNLNALRYQISRLAEEANERASRITTDSPLLSEARRTLPKSRKGEDVLFRGDLRSFKDLQKEYSRIMSFMGDWRSTEEGDSYYQSELDLLSGRDKYKGAFGGQWLKKYGETFDKSRIDEDKAIEVFKIYRNLVEEFQSEDRARMLWNKDSSKISYGSENMIIALYDMYDSGVDVSDIMNFARLRMERNYLELQGYATQEMMNEDYGMLDLDYLKSSKSRKEYLNAISKR